MFDNCYMLCQAPNSRQFYMVGSCMFSCFGYAPNVKNGKIIGHTAVDYKEYSDWRDMADDMVLSGIENIFRPFARDWG